MEHVEAWVKYQNRKKENLLDEISNLKDLIEGTTSIDIDTNDQEQKTIMDLEREIAELDHMDKNL